MNKVRIKIYSMERYRSINSFFCRNDWVNRRARCIIAKSNSEWKWQMGKIKRKSLLLQTMYITSFFFFFLACLSIVLLFVWPSINGWYWLRRILRQACQQWQYTIVGPYYTLNTWIKWFSFGKWLLSSSSSSLTVYDVHSELKVLSLL